MKYIITRTSNGLDNECPPCDGCNLEFLNFTWDEDFDIRRCFTKTFNTLEELMKFQEEVGRIIILYNEHFKMFEIEIYDYYRE